SSLLSLYSVSDLRLLPSFPTRRSSDLPLFVGVALAQAFTRPGFDFERHALSLLSLGDVGWIQVANFLVSGLLTVLFAVGLAEGADRKSTRLNSSHQIISYAVFCLKKKT